MKNKKINKKIGGPWTGSMDPVYEGGRSMDPVQRGGPWTRGPCFVLSRVDELLSEVSGTYSFR